MSSTAVHQHLVVSAGTARENLTGMKAERPRGHKSRSMEIRESTGNSTVTGSYVGTGLTHRLLLVVTFTVYSRSFDTDNTSEEKENNTDRSSGNRRLQGAAGETRDYGETTRPETTERLRDPRPRRDYETRDHGETTRPETTERLRVRLETTSETRDYE
ncbi:hypothetical protein EYF80_038946 [Liparis tanakae]|uniref:Uncharacterized protein n=1 Tax=Liparis tanakae TaxID=230148 RepID=A0A4Z2GD80_9TELE|nr:hypothetical protein EYF80_038946 [Liparis tanakae]